VRPVLDSMRRLASPRKNARSVSLPRFVLRRAVEGNTDSVGTEEFNQALSEKRAESVRAYLAKQGVPETSTTAEGFDKTRPIASNDTSDGRQHIGASS
jgi:OOP family OmpA-OmpF porin